MCFHLEYKSIKCFQIGRLWFCPLSVSLLGRMLSGDKRKICFVFETAWETPTLQTSSMHYSPLMSPSSSYPEWDIPPPGSTSSRFCFSPQKLKQNDAPQSRHPRYLVNFHKLQEGAKYIPFFHKHPLSLPAQIIIVMFILYVKICFLWKTEKYKKKKRKNISRGKTSICHLTLYCKHFSFT